MTNWKAEYDAAIADPRKARIIDAAARWVKSKLWVRDAVVAGEGPLPWRSFREWADRYWPGGFDTFRQHPDVGKIHLVPGQHLITLALIHAGVAVRHVLDAGLVQWAEIGGDRKTLITFSEALGEIDFHDRGLYQFEAPWERGLMFWLPKDWDAYDWRHNVPRQSPTRIPLTFTTSSNGDSVPNWGWKIQGPSREWLWEQRPDLRAHILRVPFGYPSPFSKFDPRIHVFETRQAWEAWRDLQLQLLPLGKAVPVPSYEPPSSGEDEPGEPEPPVGNPDATRAILAVVEEIRDLLKEKR